jgi:hypothetical protein
VSLALDFAPAQARRHVPRPRGSFTGFPATGIIDGDHRTSQIPGGPDESALLSDPEETIALGRCRASVLSFANWMGSTPTTNANSGLNQTARTLAIYASHEELLHRHARLAHPDSKYRNQMPKGQTFAGYYLKVVAFFVRSAMYTVEGTRVGRKQASLARRGAIYSEEAAVIRSINAVFFA